MRTSFVGLLSALLLVACGAFGVKGEDKDKEGQEAGQTMEPIHLTKAEFLEKVANYEANPNEWEYLGDKPAIIDFYAPWCEPCKKMAPILDELVQKYDGMIYVYKINIEQEQELAVSFGIRVIPTLLFIPMVGQPQMVQGAIGKADFEVVINDVLLKSDLFR